MVTQPLQTQPALPPETAPSPPPVVYPSSDGKPLAETYIHLYAIIVTLEVLKQYLKGQRATVLADQFLYYAQGFPRLRVAPDVMVIQNVEPGGRDSYKIWEEGEVPAVIFEMTSSSTARHDETFKYTLYEQLGVQEYWLFDPKGEWIPEQLRGYRLHREVYEPITDGRSAVLNLRLHPDGELIAFYREDTGEKLLIPDELWDLVEQERQRVEAERQRADAAERSRYEAIPKLQALGLSAQQIAEALSLPLAEVEQCMAQANEPAD
ncbi:Uma2 family endonuclease [Thermoleptolyngbya sp. M55_K2018_002]|uniref:Uma2 family endonuclease n=1 Tax=Thermoleptolyngbya sp. M55_K2018_002 TaxID=2747808 RepID=UPI001A0CE501|nr:Uma2 family endonuclease [Thermoleptolyngbya sp. M55_K2018_002]HIK43108.1 Uma2 family endonuclease [Thermoleptolyngbya sp. M55_K2018_002]